MISNTVEKARRPDIAIIGCGPTGVMSLRHFNTVANVTAFEAKDDIGGVWYYSDYNEENHPNPRSDPFYRVYGHLHSSLYDNLWTNLPKHIMTFKDFYHKEDTPHIMEAKTFHEYMKDYTRYFDLYKYIKFSTAVNSVRLLKNVSKEQKEKLGIPLDSQKKFLVTWITSKASPLAGSDGSPQGEEKKEATEEEGFGLYDYVLLCNGHFSKPNWPKIDGQEAFGGLQMHIHSLRRLDAEKFDKKRVLILGTHISATDLINLLFFRETGKDVQAERVIITGRRTERLEKSTDYKELIATGQVTLKQGGIKRFKGGKTVEFVDGTEEEIDTVVYATGYHYSFPFLTEDDGVIEFDKENPGSYFGPLYKRLFAIKEPNLIFIGVVEKIPINQATFERQIILAKQFIVGNIKLPSQEEMLKETEAELAKYDENPKLGRHNFYKFNNPFYSFWEYNEELLKMSGMEEDPCYKRLAPMVEAHKEQMINGNYWSIRTLDYEGLTKDFEFKPTASLF